MIRQRISQLLPNIFDIDPPTIQGGDPVVLTASFIKNIEVHLLLGGKSIRPKRLELSKISLFPAFGGYGILKRVVDSEPKEYYKTLWSKSSDMPTWIGSCNYERPFDDVLEAFSTTKFGGARVTKGSREALISLGDALDLIRWGKLSTNMTTDEVSSVPIPIPKEKPIALAIREMVFKNVRRLFVEGGEGRYISDRMAIDYMFSPERLGLARDHPEKWIDGTVADLPTKYPGRCRSRSLDDAAKEMGPSPDDCLLTDEWRLISRWDIVIKPWRAGKLEAVEN